VMPSVCTYKIWWSSCTISKCYAFQSSTQIMSRR